MAQAQVLDYSEARPDPDEIARLGYVGALRYLAPTPNRKVIDADELEALHKAGLAVGFVFEGGASNAFAGAGQGTKDGKVARRLADALGVPMSRPIYAAVDRDATAALFDDIEQYLRAFGAETGRPVGVYGEWSVVEAMLDRGTATYAWQTVAWSHGARSQRAVLFQRAQQVFGGGADVNDVLADDWGQWAPQSAGPPAEQDDDEVKDPSVVKLASDGTFVVFPSNGERPYPVPGVPDAQTAIDVLKVFVFRVYEGGKFADPVPEITDQKQEAAIRALMKAGL